MRRCDWCMGNPLYIDYHDHEWGVPVYDDQKLFEFLLLETFQAGLSWLTVLKKRAHFRAAFDDFNYNKIALYDANKVEELLANKHLIRHRLKIIAAIKNANAFLTIQKEFGCFSSYIWQFTGGQPVVNFPEKLADLPSSTHLSHTISQDLKKRGFAFIGPTVVYAHMQATGMVDDHLTYCWKKTKN